MSTGNSHINVGSANVQTTDASSSDRGDRRRSVVTFNVPPRPGHSGAGGSGLDTTPLAPDAGHQSLSPHSGVFNALHSSPPPPGTSPPPTLPSSYSHPIAMSPNSHTTSGPPTPSLYQTSSAGPSRSYFNYGSVASPLSGALGMISGDPGTRARSNTMMSVGSSRRPYPTVWRNFEAREREQMAQVAYVPKVGDDTSNGHAEGQHVDGQNGAYTDQKPQIAQMAQQGSKNTIYRESSSLYLSVGRS
jgi:hypothetical protein